MAREAIVLAQQAAKQHGQHHRSAHVGYYLIDHGRQTLERAVGHRPSWKSRVSRACQHHRLLLYLGPILLLTVLAIAAVLSAVGGFDAQDWRGWFFALPLVIAASALGVALVNLLVTFTVPPRTLPRLDFSEGIPDSHRTMVVVPTLLSGPQEIDELLEALAIRYLGNRDPNLFFALLTDFRGAPEQTLPGDEALLVYARTAVEALNATYRDDRPCICRRRRTSASARTHTRTTW